jgi:hypothetical protein
LIRRRPAGGGGAFLAALLAGASACAGAPLPPVAPGAPLELSADEGLLVVQIDTEVPLARVWLDRAVASGAVPSGRHVWLVRLPSGRYRFSRVAFGSRAGDAQTYRFEPGDPDVRFDLEAGKINYPGELVIRAHAVARSARGGSRSGTHSALAVRELRKVAAELLAAFPLRHAGPSRDGFLEHYSRERERVRRAAGTGGAAGVRPDPAPDAGGGVGTAARPAARARTGLSAASLYAPPSKIWSTSTTRTASGGAGRNPPLYATGRRATAAMLRPKGRRIHGRSRLPAELVQARSAFSGAGTGM